MKVNRNVRPVVKGLEKDPADRDKVDNEFLCGYFSNLKLFKELNISQNELLKVINVSTCHFVPRHEVLFRIDERGSTFFVCLSGHCLLFLPNPEVKKLKNRKL